MTKTVENRICGACGADVRPGALFCYACGSAVAPDIPLENKSSGATNVAGRGQTKAPERRFAEASGKNGEAGKTVAADAGAIKRPDEILPDEFHSKPKIDVKPAAPRREKRAAQKQEVKVVWEAAENEANVWFLLVALALVGFAGLALLAMLWLE